MQTHPLVAYIYRYIFVAPTLVAMAAKGIPSSDSMGVLEGKYAADNPIRRSAPPSSPSSGDETLQHPVSQPRSPQDAMRCNLDLYHRYTIHSHIAAPYDHQRTSPHVQARSLTFGLTVASTLLRQRSRVVNPQAAALHHYP